MTTIAPEVQKRLERAVRQLLAAGRNTQQVTEALAPQASFGKYDGCTPTAIRELADRCCRELNAEFRATVREHMTECAQIFRELPSLRRFLR